MPDPMLMSLSPACCTPCSPSWWAPSCLLLGDGLCTLHLLLLPPGFVPASNLISMRSRMKKLVRVTNHLCRELCWYLPSSLILPIPGLTFGSFWVLPVPTYFCFGHHLPQSTSTKTREVRVLYSLCLSLSRQLSHKPGRIKPLCVLTPFSFVSMLLLILFFLLLLCSPIC